MNRQTEPTNPDQQLDHLRTSLREIAHEINNPLGVLRMTAYFLERGDLAPEKMAEYVGLINQSLDRIEKSIQRLNSLRGSPPESPER